MRPVPALLGLLGLSVLFWFFPLFHVIPLEQATKQRSDATFNPDQFAETFWTQKVLKSFDTAVPATTLLPLIKSDAKAARKRFSRTLGLTDSYTFYISGTGRILEVTDRELDLAITEGATKAEVILQTGLVFGNTIRDATGLLNVSEYPNSQDFNAISEALNKIVETAVLPPLRAHAKVGARVKFVGCTLVEDSNTDLDPLRVTPVSAEVE